MARTRAGRAEVFSSRTCGVSPSISVSAARFAAIVRYRSVIEGLLCDHLVPAQISKELFRHTFAARGDRRLSTTNKFDQTSSSMYQTLDKRVLPLAITSFALRLLSIKCSFTWVLDQRHARLSVTELTIWAYASSIDPDLEVADVVPAFSHSIRSPASVSIHREMTSKPSARRGNAPLS